MKICICVLLCLTSLRRISANPVENIDKHKETSGLKPDQQKQLEKFRTVVEGLLEDDYERSDEYLLGYLASKNWKVFPAEQMLKIAKNWKKSHNYKELAESNFPKEMLARFPIKLEGYDKLGCPVTEVYFGNWNVADYLSNQEFVRDGVQNILKYAWQVMAKMEIRNRNNFPKCHQTRVISSLKNYNSTNLSEVNSIGSFVRMLNDYSNYSPNLLFAAHVLDVPDIFKPILELVKANLPANLYGIITFHEAQKLRQDLHNIVEVDKFSKILVGTVDNI